MKEKNKNPLLVYGISISLCLLALAGNYLNLPLFFGVDFIFGSIAVMLAIVLLGFVPGLIVAVIGASYTLVLWGHPYALIIFIAEAIVVSFLYQKKINNLVLSDLIFWVCLGIPLVIVFYQYALGLSFDIALSIAFKQSLNGIFNTLLAGVIVIVFKLFTKIRHLFKLSSLQLPELLFHIILLVMLLAGSIPVIHESYTLRAEDEYFIQQKLENEAYRIEQIYKQDESSIADIRQYYHLFPLAEGMGIKLIGSDKSSIMEIGVVKSSNDIKGEHISLADKLMVWLPDMESSLIKRWKQGRYYISNELHYKQQQLVLIVEQSAANIIQRIEQKRLVLFYLLSAIVLLGIIFSFTLSRWLSRPLNEFRHISSGLTKQIEQGEHPQITLSAIEEYANLGHSLDVMSTKLLDSFDQLKENKQQLELLVEQRTKEVKRLSEVARQSTNGVIITDRNGYIEWINEGFTRISGYSLSELTGKKPGEVLQGEKSDPKIVKRMSDAILQGSSFTETIINYNKSNQPYWVNITCNPLLDNENQIYGFMAIETDISQKKLSEQALKEQARHTRAVLDNILDGIITIDSKGIINSFNPAAEKIFDYKEQEVLGKNVNILMPEPHHSAHNGYIKNYCKTGQAGIIGIGREVEAQRKDGSLFPMDLTITEISQRGKQIFIGKVTDISEKKHIEKMKREFVSVVSHELRTPLTSISGSLGLVAGGALGKLPDKAKEMVSIAYKNSQRLTIMINDLLDIEKLAAGKMHFEMKVQNIIPLIAQAVYVNQNYGSEKNVSLVFNVKQPDYLINTDEQRFMQIMSNLLSNAIKFSPENDQVVISLTKEHNQLKVAIKDNGSGIDDAFKAKVFTRFAQADSSDTRKKGGTGLGLAITRELVEKMNGSIGFESESGSGAKFYFSFPVYESPQFENNTVIDELIDHKQKILIVEDDPDIAHVLSNMLLQENYPSRIAYTGEQALKFLHSEQFVAITLDLVLPDISGLEIIKQIRNNPGLSKLPIIVISAKIHEGKLAINGDFSDIEWIAKPINQDLLITTLDQYVVKSHKKTIKLLLLSEDKLIDKLLSKLASDKIAIHVAETISEAEVQIKQEAYDLFVIDSETSYIDIMLIIKMIKANQKNHEIILLTSDDLSKLQKKSIESEVFDSVISSRELMDTIKLRMIQE